MKYKVKIEPEALADIQDITDWYNKRKVGLGKRFQAIAIKQINGLKKDPHICTIRYNEIRCMVVKNFPYMIHFYINDETRTVEVLAVFSTDRDTKIWQERTSNK
jgi:plasmid stabilization system protein ParE